MAQFDVYRSRTGEELLLDCQSDILGDLKTRFVVPLVDTSVARQATRLHPIFVIEGHEMIMATQLAAAVDRRELGNHVANLSNEHDRIIGALDMLISGF